uniref:Uncharacterized protein n=1 Tax=Leersia perrieri TaxID=77586 RepID=A0A0D9VBT2_9ORYZ
MVGWWFLSWWTIIFRMRMVRRKPSSVFYWAGCCYAFERRNLIRDAVEVPVFSFT